MGTLHARIVDQEHGIDIVDELRKFYRARNIENETDLILIVIYESSYHSSVLIGELQVSAVRTLGRRQRNHYNSNIAALILPEYFLERRRAVSDYLSTS